MYFYPNPIVGAISFRVLLRFICIFEEYYPNLFKRNLSFFGNEKWGELCKRVEDEIV